MTTLELHLNDDLNAFVLRQCRARGYESAEAYVESLLAIERLRERSDQIDALLQEAINHPDEPQEIDDDYWKRVDAEVFGNRG